MDDYFNMLPDSDVFPPLTPDLSDTDLYHISPSPSFSPLSQVDSSLVFSGLKVLSLNAMRSNFVMHAMLNSSSLP